MTTIRTQLQAVHLRIAQACAIAQRPVPGIALLAVSKAVAADRVREAYACGQRCFGENYVQEALAKIELLGDLRPGIEWHMIGPLQSNKARLVAEHFDWVHSVDRLKLAEQLNTRRPERLAPMNVCLQVNISAEKSKSGLMPEEVSAVAHALDELPRLRLRGLMAIPQPAQTFEAQRGPHRALRELFEALKAQGLSLDTLSMGMSDDLEAAVVEGATVVRVGSAIFGQR
ncbi:MAG: YggS family pyridoxal phosphate-dependent enzyme [Burkholderiaceae bacterium]|nr:YggS family pyridoxal phosphate-dependent enzyme [Burkholderiaceae bacterium]MDH3459424.1 YggS family pyridoxal phosphate-dependent enzyme [Burkholderiaceae bacterium]